MGRHSWVKSLLLITVLASISFPASSSFVEGLASDKGHAVGAVASRNQKSLWDWLFGEKKGRGGSRGDFCSIWPNGDDPDLLRIWNARPLFVWKGTVKRIEVRLPGSGTALWSHDVTKNEQSVLYTGSALQPGEEYDYWVMYETSYKGETKTNIQTIPFEIMKPEERYQVEAELAALKDQSETLSAEEIALQRAKYFAEHKLWSDVVIEIFSVPNPSSELASVIEKIRAEEGCVIKPKPID